MYLHPSFVLSMDQGKVSTNFYTIMVPMLNPLIYICRNKEVKIALKKSLSSYYRPELAIIREYKFVLNPLSYQYLPAFCLMQRNEI
jgi:hypothetical protein